MEKLRERNPNVISEVRGFGLIKGLHIIDPSGQPSIPFAQTIAAHCFDNGCFLRNNKNVLAFKPPLTITNEQIEEACEAIARSIDQALEQ